MYNQKQVYIELNGEKEDTQKKTHTHTHTHPTILPEIVGFFKYVGEIQQLVHYISLPIYPIHSKILPHSKTIKNTKKCSVFGKNDSYCLFNFLQTHFFYLEPTIKLITGAFDLQK